MDLLLSAAQRRQRIRHAAWIASLQLVTGQANAARVTVDAIVGMICEGWA